MRSMDVLIPPPHSIEAEHAVLGGIVLDNKTWDLIAGELKPQDFYSKDNGDLFSLIAELSQKSQPFDVVTLSELAIKNGLGGSDYIAYIGEICSNTPSTANIEAYRDIVKERAQLRRLIAIGHECTRLSSTHDAASEDVREVVERKLFELSGESSSGFADLTKVMSKVIDQIDLNLNSGSGLIGVDTGFKELNEKTAGWNPADLIILAARPSMGKTALCLSFILTALNTLENNKTVQFFSLEMPVEAIMYRLLAMIGQLNMQKLRIGQLDALGWQKLSVAATKLKEYKDRLIIDDESSLTPAKLRSKSRRASRQFGEAGLIVVDYLQLMRSGKSRVENRNLEIAEISASLKSLAKEMNCPVIALSQLNRSLENRPNKRPHNGDLRESGAIEQDADVIVFIYRDEVYNPETDDAGIAELIIGKNRNGPTGMLKTAFIADQARFENLSYNSL